LAPRRGAEGCEKVNGTHRGWGVQPRPFGEGARANSPPGRRRTKTLIDFSNSFRQRRGSMTPGHKGPETRNPHPEPPVQGLLGSRLVADRLAGRLAFSLYTRSQQSIRLTTLSPPLNPPLFSLVLHSLRAYYHEPGD